MCFFLFKWPELLAACALPGLASGQVLHHFVCFPKHVSCHFAAAKQVGGRVHVLVVAHDQPIDLQGHVAVPSM
jgi:hypothetical protein